MAKNTHGFLFRGFSVRPITRGLEYDSCTNNRQVSWLTDYRVAYNLPDFSVACPLDKIYYTPCLQ